MIIGMIAFAFISLKISELVEEALRNNPEIASLKAEWEASSYVIRYSGFPENPEIEFGRDVGFGFGIKQSIPFPSILKKRKEVAVQIAGKKYWDLESTRLRIIKELKISYFNLWLLNSQYELFRRIKLLFEDLENLAMAKYEVGEGILQDVLRTRVEKLRIEERMITVRAQAEEQKSKIIALVGKPVNLDKIEDSPDVKIELEVGELEKIAESSSPLINLAQAFEKVAIQNLKLAKVESLPSFGLSAGWMSFRGESMPIFRIAIEVPSFFFWKEKEVIREAEKLHASSYLSYLDARNKIFARIRAIYELMRASENLVKLYETSIIPHVRYSFEAARSAYAVGKADFLKVLENTLLLLFYETEYLRERAQIGMYSAELEEIVGVNLTSKGGDLK